MYELSGFLRQNGVDPNWAAMILTEYFNLRRKGLGTQMQQHTEIDWSQVATEAFERKFETLSIKPIGKLESLVKRLKDSRAEMVSRDRLKGLESGRSWATNLASFEELDNLSNWWNTTSKIDRDWYLTTKEDDPNGVGRELACLIMGKCNDDWDASDEFWSNAEDSDDGPCPPDLFFRAFAQGALEVWNSVKEMT